MRQFVIHSLAAAAIGALKPPNARDLNQRTKAMLDIARAPTEQPARYFPALTVPR